jgi:lipopolysaccharide/colanic/teichoic acid biosynthesis glycosyltransferase
MNATISTAPSLRPGTSLASHARGAVLAIVHLLGMDVGPAMRRTLDVVGVSLAMLVAGPVLAIAAVAIKLTSKGPLFFRQVRVGRDGKRFEMLKLRTMRTGAEAAKASLERASAEARSGVRFKLRQDPRITPVGRWLRKLSIDELPQLWNIMRGEMTIVGPRPAVPREVDLYDARALRRLEVTPGLTCLWQVGGRSDLSFEQQVSLDLTFVDRVRWMEELRIVLMTVPAVLSGRGAY